MKKLLTLITLFCLVSACTGSDTKDHVFMANGIKSGEVTQTSAIVWTRLTLNPERNKEGIQFKYDDKALPEGKTLNDMIDSAVGKEGEVRLIYWVQEKGGVYDAITTDWVKVSKKNDCIHQFKLTKLKPNSFYRVKAQGRAFGEDNPNITVYGQFITAPDKNTSRKVSFTVVTGQEYTRRDDDEKGHKIYPHMLKLRPDFFVHTGDIVYYDKGEPYAPNIELGRHKWNHTYAYFFQREFHNNVASYFMKDDHDSTCNDSWPSMPYGDITWEQGLALFREQVPMGDKTYRTIRWGKHLQIWLVEGRDFRSPNTMEDGPTKTIWGKEQKKWFFETFKKSDATFRILISPTPVVGPDRSRGKNDNHSNKAFQTEGDEIRKFLKSQKNAYVVCGDRHWQYVSEDTNGIREYSCGPTSNKHAGGWRNSMITPMHKYLNVQGGFLSVTVEEKEGKPTAIFRHYNVDGKVSNEDIRIAK